MSTSDKEDQTQQEAEKTALMESAQKEPAQLVVFLRDRAGIYFHLEDGHLARADELIKLVIEEQDLPSDASNVFCLWFVSPILDIRLKAHHQPFQIVQQWDQLCALYTDASNDEIRDSEPVLMVQRDVFYPKDKEVLMNDEQMLCLLYHEAKFNVVHGRYPLHVEDYHRLAGLQAVIHLGKYSPQSHVLADYRANLLQFYPACMHTKERFLFFPRSWSQARDCEELFMEAHQKVSEEFSGVDVDQSFALLYRKYLEVCWSYPFYGAAFFSGQVETPTSRLKKLMFPPPDTEVRVAINTECVTVIDSSRSEVLLSIPYSQLKWDFRDPDFDGDNDPPPCLYLQFLASSSSSDGAAGCPGNGEAEGGVEEGGARHKGDEEEGRSGCMTKLLKVYSREAKLMDALIETCVRRKLQQQQEEGDADVVDSGPMDSSCRKVTNKLNRLCLTQFSADGDELQPQ